MNFKDLPILIIFSLFLGVMIFGQSTPDMQVAPEPPQTQTDPPLSVWGQTALFIGDSILPIISLGGKRSCAIALA